jgi:hypothetical protein
VYNPSIKFNEGQKIMKNSFRILLSILAITSTMVSADETFEKVRQLDKFSYHGVGFKSSKADLEGQRFTCNQMRCSRNEKDTQIDVVFTGDQIQKIDARTRYNSRIDCLDNQKEIKNFLADTYDFEYVNQDYKVLGMNVKSEDLGGNIKTKDGSIWVNVSCMNDPKINMSYVSTRFDLKDISYQNFKDAFKYE